eukprot:3973713-Pleurochrysis_carterae.AAC.2
MMLRLQHLEMCPSQDRGHSPASIKDGSTNMNYILLVALALLRRADLRTPIAVATQAWALALLAFAVKKSSLKM